jgi:hypothetical protein
MFIGEVTEISAEFRRLIGLDDSLVEKDSLTICVEVLMKRGVNSKEILKGSKKEYPKIW